MTAIAYHCSEAFANEMDRSDPLHHFKDLFFYPKIDGKAAIYLCGNSLGLQPKSVRDEVHQELQNWSELGVEGHFSGTNPWVTARLRSKPMLAEIVGAKPEEVVAMGSLTANLHFLLVSFYQPTKVRFKILMESDAFPSDRYMLESQVRFHGLNPKDAIIEVSPRAGEKTLRTEDILQTIKDYGNELALIMMSGIQYYTGQLFDLPKITRAGKSVGAVVGFDLAHAAGNVPLRLHEWEVDFAAWCSYKYLNSGPGNVAGIFVHKKHGDQPELKRLAGWWGHDEHTRFAMDGPFKAMPGADGWLLSNDNVLGLAAHQASLEIFSRAGMANLRRKSELLTGYLEFLIRQIIHDYPIEIITPQNPEERGCQLSILFQKGGKEIFDGLYDHGVIGDWRNPNVIRLAPTPLYNGFVEVYTVAKLLERLLENTYD
jgi:kynureninase